MSFQFRRVNGRYFVSPNLRKFGSLGLSRRRWLKLMRVVSGRARFRF